MLVLQRTVRLSYAFTGSAALVVAVCLALLPFGTARLLGFALALLLSGAGVFLGVLAMTRDDNDRASGVAFLIGLVVLIAQVFVAYFALIAG